MWVYREDDVMKLTNIRLGYQREISTCDHHDAATLSETTVRAAAACRVKEIVRTIPVQYFAQDDIVRYSLRTNKKCNIFFTISRFLRQYNI